jgi:inward rectifier potassium channel
MRPQFYAVAAGRTNAVVSPPVAENQLSTTPIHVVGAPRERVRDLYHMFLRTSWPMALTAIVVAFLALNTFFAVLYDLVGGLQNARTGSFADAFFFSVQTMATIGYGGIHPVTRIANIVVVAEAVVGLLVTALATGLVFAKFSVSNARIAFAHKVVITPMDGVPTLMLRLGNERSNQILEATLRLTLLRTERTREGVTFYRMYDLKLTRERTQAFSRSWTALHIVDEESPLYGASPESLKRDEAELLCGVVGIDDVSLQPVHARHTYEPDNVVFGARHVDILTENGDGSITLDLRRFHDTIPTEPTPDFPYPRG